MSAAICGEEEAEKEAAEQEAAEEPEGEAEEVAEDEEATAEADILLQNASEKRNSRISL